uniref:Defensin, beta-like 3 n=2 Tax=Cyprinus carpio TaxID=7962 RepID=A0A9J7ZUD9_CYPCA
MSYNMRALGLIIITLLLLTAGEADDTDAQGWTCGYRGLCRKHCYAQEYMIGYHGCPRRYRICTAPAPLNSTAMKTTVTQHNDSMDVYLFLTQSEHYLLREASKFKSQFPSYCY